MGLTFVEITHRLVDNYGNPVPDNTEVLFMPSVHFASGASGIVQNVYKAKTLNGYIKSYENTANPFKLPTYDDGTSTAEFTVVYPKITELTGKQDRFRTINLNSSSLTQSLSSLFTSTPSTPNPTTATVNSIVEAKAVRFDAAQSLTALQKRTGRNNLGFQLKTKTADETKSDTTPTADTELITASLPVGEYIIRAKLFTAVTLNEAMESGGFSCTLNGGNVVAGSVKGMNKTSTASSTSIGSITSLSGGASSAQQVILVEIDVRIVVSTAGTLAISWAMFQPVSEGAVTLKEGSYLEVIPV